MKIKLSIAVCLLIKTTLLSAQSSAQVSSAENLFNSDIQTGTPSINIPIHNFVSRDISVPISLNYTGGNGLKVNEEASWVGLGWYLQAGGFITQQVRGNNDFQNLTGYPDRLPYLNGQTTFPLTSANWNDYWNQKSILNSTNYTSLDLEPDVFKLSIPGYSVSFFFDSKGVIYQASQTPLKIEYNLDFIVTTPDGLVYTFHTLSRNVNLDKTEIKESWKGFTWYLMSIYSPKSKETVTFEYSADVNTLDSKYNFYSKTIYTRSNMANDLQLFTYINNEKTDYRAFNDGTKPIYCMPTDGSAGIKVGATSSYGCPTQILNNEIVEHMASNTVILSGIYGKQGYVEFLTSSRTDVGSKDVKLTDIKVYSYGETVNDNILLTYSYANSITDKNLVSHNTFSYSYFVSGANTSGTYYEYPYVNNNGSR